MKIRTKSIIDQIELELDKDIESITEEDLVSIKNIAINGIDILGEHQSVYVDDIKYFVNLESIIINNMEIDEVILDILRNINSLKSIVFNRCELIDFPCVLYNIIDAEFDFCDNFCNEILNSFPNVVNLTIKGYSLNYIPRSVKRLNIPKCSISNYEIFNDCSVEELLISLEEYNKNKALYDDLKAKVYDENDIYLVKGGN